MGRVLRLNKIIAFLNVIEDVKAMIQLIKMVFYLMIYIHLYACFWWYLVKDSQIWIPYSQMSYVDYYQIYKDPILSQYLLCLNQSILVLLGSDIGPLTFN